MYEKQWANFRKLNRRGIISVIAVFPTMLLTGYFGNMLSVFLYVGVVALIAEVISYVVTVIQIRAFPCPRCEKPFTVLFKFGPNTRGRKCVHCGLELNEQF